MEEPLTATKVNKIFFLLQLSPNAGIGGGGGGGPAHLRGGRRHGGKDGREVLVAGVWGGEEGRAPVWDL